jgi:hypothetical protein
MPVTVSAAAAKAPPVKTPKATTPKNPTAPAPSTDERAKALSELLAIPTAVLVTRRMFADAGTVQAFGPRLMTEIAKIAATQPRVAAVVDPLTKIGPFSELLSVAVIMGLQFGVNHGQVPAGVMGTVPPSMLAAQIETEIARAEVNALRMQLEAERKVREIKAEIDEARNEVMAQAANAA